MGQPEIKSGEDIFVLYYNITVEEWEVLRDEQITLEQRKVFV